MNTRYSEYPLCRHTRINGRRCQSPALTSSAFCYHHRKLRRTRASTIDAGPAVTRLSRNVLNPLRDANSIRHALAMVLGGLASNQLHPKQAGRMIYALQVAFRLPEPEQNEDLSGNPCKV
jgi:hypothetical protein